MTVLQIVFLVTGLVTLLAGVMVVASPKLVHAALWLIVSLAGVAVLFVLLNANFLAVVQVVVYIGAIAILVIFAVMLTRRVMADTGPTHNPTWWLALISALVLFGGLLALITQLPAFGATEAALPGRGQPDRPGHLAGGRQPLPAAVRGRLGAAARGADRRHGRRPSGE